MAVPVTGSRQAVATMAALKKIIICGAAGVITLAAGCGSSPSGGQAASSTAKASVATACDDLANWESSGGSNVAQVKKEIDRDAPGTAFARDFAAWANGTGQNTKLIADCRPLYPDVLSLGQPAQPAPACNPSAWEGNNIGGEPPTVATDVSNIHSDAADDDDVAIASDGHQLYLDALAALHNDMPPRCAKRLYHDAKLMLLSLSIAGSELYLAPLDPAKTASLDNLATQNLSYATRYYNKVEAACGNC